MEKESGGKADFLFAVLHLEIEQEAAEKQRFSPALFCSAKINLEDHDDAFNPNSSRNLAQGARFTD